jgi:nicotinamidase-related amidase
LPALVDQETFKVNLLPSSHKPFGPGCAHICVDVQAMFAQPTAWHAPWLNRVLPAIEAIVGQQSSRTVFTRFVPPASPEMAHGAWQQYYDRWNSMTRDRLPQELIDVVPSLRRYAPPALILDKTVYSPWFNTRLHERLRAGGIDTLVITGGETEVCVLATVLGAIDHGYHVVLATDALFSSADETHDAMQTIFHSRYGIQLTTATTQDVLDAWKS